MSRSSAIQMANVIRRTAVTHVAHTSGSSCAALYTPTVAAAVPVVAAALLTMVRAWTVSIFPRKPNNETSSDEKRVTCERLER